MLKTWWRSDVRKEREEWLRNQIRSAGKTLYLSHNTIDDEDAKAIATALQRKTKLTKLILSYNKIGNEGATAIAEALQQNTVLTNLSLWGNNIGDIGATAIAKALQKNTALTELYLRNNHIGNQGATAIATALQRNTVLTVLDLRNNNIGDIGATAIAKLLQRNSTLTNLSLGFNKNGDKGATAIAKALHQNTVMTKLDLGNNNIGNEGATAIAEALQQKTILTVLYLNDNNIGDEGARAIAKSLQRNTALTRLNLRNNNIDASALAAIKSLLQMSAEERRQQKETAMSTLLLESQSSTENQTKQLDDSLDDKKEDEVVVSGTNIQPIENTAVAVPPLSQQQLLEVANLLGIVSKIESADMLNRLLPLADHVDPLTAVAHDQQCASAAEQELSVIRNDQQNREFYLSLYDSLDCTIAACQTLASGMIEQAESKTGIRSWILKMTKDTAWKSLKEHTDIRQVVNRSIQWAAKQIPLPFADTAGKAVCVLFHTLFSLKQEHQKYLAIANVAAFAVIAKHNKGGLHQTISNVCCYMVRDGRFVGSKPEFKQWQSWAAKMLADASTTRCKAQGCLVAELVMQCIMAPPPKSVMDTILHEGADSSNVDAALTSLVLNMSAGEVVKLKSITTSLAHDRVAADVPDEAADVPDDHSCAPSDKPDIQQVPSDVDLIALQKFVQQQAQEISKLKSKLRKLSNQGEARISVDVGNGQVQVFATSSFEEQWKEPFAALQKEVGAITDQLLLVTAASDTHREQITKLEETNTDLYDTVNKLKDDGMGIAKKKKGLLGIPIGRPDP